MVFARSSYVIEATIATIRADGFCLIICRVPSAAHFSSLGLAAHGVPRFCPQSKKLALVMSEAR
ncbi:hypothetical protein C7B77_21220 [Chamaesiphon polymorphus CCALA 037]|uniref:Uncharacterized protein n=1 Tax=Chamaesiphon polymorphus CCALA 037 TaxID=2107692 RepID=A0A2T1G3F2_9CYAN|nr:hypothetical protein C7B77_21220 [Chamaesiphon polymorphus CCALA 037]